MKENAKNTDFVDSLTTADIIAFPSNHLVGKARDVAREIVERCEAGKDGFMYWTGIIRHHFKRRLEKLGFGEEDVYYEMTLFRMALEVELNKFGYEVIKPDGFDADDQDDSGDAA